MPDTKLTVLEGHTDMISADQWETFRELLIDRMQHELKGCEPYSLVEVMAAFDSAFLEITDPFRAAANEIYAIATQRGINPEVLNHVWTSRGLASPQAETGRDGE